MERKTICNRSDGGIWSWVVSECLQGCVESAGSLKIKGLFFVLNNFFTFKKHGTKRAILYVVMRALVKKH